ncbi:methyltransferase domain-containing protein [Paenibacillus filicis]|uniref:Methyltransferase domain-containing protein n=1 Tax=Paenibacillus filicis TaxID=669464 RepID=A0ABU9DIK5_9BACL
MNNDRLESILARIGADQAPGSIQRVQTAHRIELAEFWGIQSGERILEIGCGQGDTTAVSAYMVGEEGHVHGIDIASPHYGAPMTLGEATARLQQSSLGKQIRIEFETDILSSEVSFPDRAFDKIVLSHCSWYLPSFEVLSAILQRVRPWGTQLCIAEWDPRIRTIGQFPHFLAASIQAQYECYKTSSLSNIRTLFTPDDIRRLAEQAGWRSVKEASIDSSALQDGGWEVDMVISDYQSELEQLGEIPARMKAWIHSQIGLLQDYAEQPDRIESMSTFAWIAD